MRFTLVPALVSLICAACDGDNGDPTVDATPGTPSAAITGTLAEQSITPTTAFYGTHPLANQDVLVMPEGAAVCDLENPAAGLAAIIGFPCGPVEVRTYAVKATSAACDPAAPHVWMIVEGFDGEIREHDAATGSVTFTAIATTVAGTFSAEFGDKGELTGSFDAAICP